MKTPKNKFKENLKQGVQQLGIWNTIGGNTVPEALANCGFDWVLVDTEHAAVETVEVISSLQAIAGNPEVSAVVRPAANDPVLIKRVLDMGALTLLLPYVQTAEEARSAVKSISYGPKGVRGIAGSTRATRYGLVENYFQNARDEICLLVQVESIKAIQELEQIATTDGIDGVFIGPGDLSSSMGYPGELEHPEVVSVIKDALNLLNKLNVPSGILALNTASANMYMEQGTKFTAVGVDLVLLTDAARNLRGSF
jgi:4-hydroxy-2-oxoheptanedioate aldolase